MLPVKVICNLVREDKSAIRAALLRSGAIRALVQNIHKDDVLVALCDLAACRSSHIRLRQYACVLIHQLCHEEIHQSRAAQICYLLQRSGVKFTSKRMRDKLFAAILVHLHPQNPGPWSNLMEQALYPEMPVGALLSTLAFRLFDQSCVQFYTALCRHSNAAAKYVIKTFGARLVALVQNDFSIGPLLRTYLLQFLQASWFDRALLDVVDIAESIPLISRFLQVAPHTIFLIRRDPAFEKLIFTMVQALDILPLQRHAQTFLLQLMIADPHAMPSQGVDAFKAHLVVHPYAFAVNIDNAPPAALENVIRAGEKLGVSAEKLVTIRTRLLDLKEEERQAQRRDSLGLVDIDQPDAFMCPVTMEVMRDPVVASDGHTYERSTLTRILATTRISPLTRAKLRPGVVIPNHNLRKRIREYSDDLCSVIERRQKVTKIEEDVEDRR